MPAICPECRRPISEHKLQRSRREDRATRLSEIEDYRHHLARMYREGKPTGDILSSAAQTLADLGPPYRTSVVEAEDERRDRESVLADQRRRKA